MNLFHRYKRFAGQNRPLDNVRKITSYVLDLMRPLWTIGRKIRVFYLLKKWNIVVGKRVLIKGLPINVTIGDYCDLYDNVIIEFLSQHATMALGNRVLLSYGALISCGYKITIGNSVQIGEFTSIRDTSHVYNDLSRPMRDTADVAEEIIIGNDVWIGRGCIIMPGTIIEDGVVVGANSVVKGRLEANGIYAGSPARLIKKR